MSAVRDPVLGDRRENCFASPSTLSEISITLTVIALCLLWRCVQSLISPRASAAQSDQRVFIKDMESTLPVAVSNRVRIDRGRTVR